MFSRSWFRTRAELARSGNLSGAVSARMSTVVSSGANSTTQITTDAPLKPQVSIKSAVDGDKEKEVGNMEGLMEMKMLPLNGSEDVTGSLPTWKLMQWNVLAQNLIRREKLYPYCSKGALRHKRRHENTQAALKNWTADILCLQEVGEWDKYWEPLLKGFGFDARFMAKKEEADPADHGVVVAWKSGEWKPVDVCECRYNLEAERDSTVSGPSHAEIAHHPQVGLGVALEHVKTGRGVIIATTHLFWDPVHPFARLKQSEWFLKALTKWRTESAVPWVRKAPGFWAGDFNTTPEDCVYRALTKTPPEIAPGAEFMPQLHFRPDCGVLAPDGSIDGISPTQRTREVAHSLSELYSTSMPRLRSVYRNYESLPGNNYDAPGTYEADEEILWSGEPPWTVLTEGFRGTLDYIFEMDWNDGAGWGAEQVTPIAISAIPRMADGTVQVALPNDRWASDHVPVAVEVQFKE